MKTVYPKIYERNCKDCDKMFKTVSIYDFQCPVCLMKRLETYSPEDVEKGVFEMININYTNAMKFNITCPKCKKKFMITKKGVFNHSACMDCRRKEFDEVFTTKLPKLSGNLDKAMRKLNKNIPQNK